MKRHLLTALFLFSAFTACAQGTSASVSDKPRPFEGHFFCKATGVSLFLNLYEEDVVVPNFSFLGKMNGYMRGNIYGTWMLVKHEVKGRTALLRFSNDIGSDTQEVEFVQKTDSLYTYHAKGSNVIRRAVGRNLVKVAADMEFVRM